MTLEVPFHHNAIKQFESYKKYTGSKNFISGQKFRFAHDQAHFTRLQSHFYEQYYFSFMLTVFIFVDIELFIKS